MERENEVRSQMLPVQNPRGEISATAGVASGCVVSEFGDGGCCLLEMSERSDMELLREYAEGGGEAAFREIVVRHTDLLYSAALRQVESPDQARDVLQNVFADLARKARFVSRTEREGSSLAGGLYRGVRFECANQRREQRRRRDRERIAMAEADTPSEPESDWTRIGPVLDEAIAELSDADREALLLRFFRNQDFKAVGRSLGVSDDTAQKRVSRALERLRSRFLRRGLPTSAAALSAVLSSSAVHAAPTGLAAALSVSATAWAAMPPVAVASLSQAIAMTTFKKIVVGTAFAAAVGTGIYETREAVRWRREVGDLVEKQEALLRRTEEAEQAREAAARELADTTR
ncbi:MAG: sigma-70 family RNA polymerase sigma factor, partial [Verrucomicrobiales bacterium]|nr:sigma-70 family RNA polymerase sigma factor [Verrucomicrobiales bacterium]